jgi:hypothetical protein
VTEIPSLPGEWQACPRCGDPLITGCRPAAGICVVDPDEGRTVLLAPGMSALTDEEYAHLAAADVEQNREMRQSMNADGEL